MAQLGSASALGAESRRFESGRPDHETPIGRRVSPSLIHFNYTVSLLLPNSFQIFDVVHNDRVHEVAVVITISQPRLSRRL